MAGASIASSALNTANNWGMQLQNQKFNAQEAQKNRDFQERMSNTAYQRAKADMEAAGINAQMALGNGANSASTPGGATASGAIGAGNSIENPMNSIAQLTNSAANFISANKNIQANKTIAKNVARIFTKL